MSRHVHAAGGVLWRREGEAVQVALVHRPRYDDWSLPKGKLDEGELHVVGALREVAEETGCTGVAGRTLGASRYRVLDRGRDVPKTVRWWAMRCTAGEFVPGPEVDHLQWLTVPQALRRVTAGRDFEPLLSFASHPPETTTVLLVRHGSAGDRERWRGEEALRPLDERGREQADAAAQALLPYAPVDVRSAPALRCTATVAPLAARLGTDVVVDERWSEDLWHTDPKAVLVALEELAGAGRTTVACSQGSPVQEAVAALTTQAGLELDRVRARKGCLWALSFSAGQLVDADYTADLRPGRA